MARRGTRRSGNKLSKPTTLEAIMRSASFVRGVTDYRKGKTWSGDQIEVGQVWRYERGRQFAVLFTGPIKNGHKVRFEALVALENAMRSRDIL